MTWLVFGVSCLLVLAGAVSIISGAPIIQLERGWAEVIAGSMALSSGGVVFALALILMRLESLRDALVANVVPSPVPAPLVQPVPESPAADLAPAASETELPPPTRPEPKPLASITADEKPARQGLWKDIPRPNPDPAPTPSQAEGFPDRIVPEAAVPVERSDDPPVIVPSHDTPDVVAEPGEEPVREAGRLPTRSPQQVGWLERSLLKSRLARTQAEEVESAGRGVVGGSSRSDRLATDLDRIEPRLGTPSSLFGEPAEPVAAPAVNPAAEPTPTPDLATEAHEGTTVIGRYQAGSASYVMYSDGTIEVETENGQLHRFGSMDELKAYIAGQETTPS